MMFWRDVTFRTNLERRVIQTCVCEIKITRVRTTSDVREKTLKLY